MMFTPPNPRRKNLLSLHHPLLRSCARLLTLLRLGRAFGCSSLYLSPPSRTRACRSVMPAPCNLELAHTRRRPLDDPTQAAVRAALAQAAAGYADPWDDPLCVAALDLVDLVDAHERHPRATMCS